MSLIDSLKEEVANLRKENTIKIEIINSLTEKNQLNAPVFLQNKHPNSESNISLANNGKIVILKFHQKISIIETIPRS